MKTIRKESPGCRLMKIHNDSTVHRLDFDLPDKCVHTCLRNLYLNVRDGEGGATVISIHAS